MSSALTNDEVDALLSLVAIAVQNRFCRPISLINDVCDSLCVFEPPSITIFTQEVQADIFGGDLKLLDFRILLTDVFEFVE